MIKSLVPTTLLLLIASTALAAGLKDYRHRVGEAAVRIQRLIDEETEEPADEINRIKGMLPKSENVEVKGETITVDNGWLHDMLDASEQQNRPRKRIEKLRLVKDRLSALDEQLRDSEQAISDEQDAAGPTEKVREILARQPYRQKTDDPATAFIKEIRRKVVDFIADVLRGLFGKLVGTGTGANIFFTVLLVIGLGSAVFLAIRILRSRGARKVEKKRSVLGEEIEEGVTSADLANAALAAARAGDFRTAIRKLYISLLYELAERDIIQIEAHTTNHEYLAGVAGFGSLAAPMRYMTDRFDYFWYGMFSSSEEDFRQYLERYGEAMERARSAGQQAAKA